MKDKQNNKSHRDTPPREQLDTREDVTELKTQWQSPVNAAVTSKLVTENSAKFGQVQDATLATQAVAQSIQNINQLFQQQHAEHGYLRAKNDVNEALVKDPITLNRRFELHSVIGAGGMGSVFKARDKRKVEAQDAQPFVAVKVLNNDFKTHPQAFVSLQREASRSHLLSHPHIVTVHDFDRDGDTIYMTMELLQGEALDLMLQKRRLGGLAKNEAFKLIGQLCNALAYAHQKGIIHSDLKPANLFVTNQGLKILDFGIARLVAESLDTDEFDAGQIGAITPAYASLEMLDNQAPDPRDDIYAVAIIAYQLLSGRHPYDGKSAAAAKALNMQPERIAGLSKRQWRALSTALAFKRENRTTSIKKFQQNLTESMRVPVFKFVSILLLLVVGWFSYLKFIVPDELSVFVGDSLKKAQDCLQLQEYSCTADSAKAVLEVDRENLNAQQLLVTANQAQRQQQQQQIIAEELSSARRCLENQDYDCSLQLVDNILSLDPENASALAMADTAKQNLAQAERLLAEKNSRFEEKLQAAKRCERQRNYNCAITNAKAALLIRANDPAAETALANAQYALAQKRQNLVKANKILLDGEICFKKLNYSCAIAKSESALEFVAGHERAFKLKRAAEQAIAAAKKNIEIE